MANYSMWLVEYARCPVQAVGSVLSGQYNGGLMTLSFTYLVLKGEDHVAMVDVGYSHTERGGEMAEHFGVVDWQPPSKTLAKIGLQPEDVDTILLTHAHFDHMGNLPAFPRAHFYLQKRELIEWLSVLALPKRFSFLASAINPQDILDAVNLSVNGRMTLMDGAQDNILPGIHMKPLPDSHTFGSQMVVINNSSGPGAGPWVFGGDNGYTRDNFTGIHGDGVMVPVGFGVGNQMNMLTAMDNMTQLVCGKMERVIIGHDPANWDLYPSWVTQDDRLHVAELNLAPGEPTRRP